VGDSAAKQCALYALSDLDDSAGTGVPVLERALPEARSVMFRRGICNTLGFWTSTNNEAARRAIFCALSSPDAKGRLAAVEANSYLTFDGLKEGIILKLKDPDPSIRAAALYRVNQLERDRVILAGIYIESLDDSSAAVRLTVARYMAQSL